MRYKNGNIILSSGRFQNKNFLAVENLFYSVENLSDKHPRSKGGNSSVFKLVNPNNDAEYAIKFCKFPIDSNTDWDLLANTRFEHEISALKHARAKQSPNIIKFYFDGKKKIDGRDFRYYVMEKGEEDLKTFLTENEIPLNQKKFLCLKIAEGIVELHEMDLYHRDIKPDNIIRVWEGANSAWKIGDLGLSRYRLQDFAKEEFGKKIGPYGWLSPEVMNKVLCEGTRNQDKYNCVIDKKSDIFQLGKLFWFIYQGNIPIGQVRFADFTSGRKDIYDLLKKMIQYKKGRRIKTENLLVKLQEFAN